MKDQNKRKAQLIEELTQLRQEIADLKAAETNRREAEQGPDKQSEILSGVNKVCTVSGDRPFANDDKRETPQKDGRNQP